MKRKIIVALVTTPILLLAQIPTSDVVTHLGLWKEIGQAATQIAISGRTATSVRNTELWLGQVFLSKLPWGTTFPKTAQNSSAANTIGELATYSQTLATGYGAGFSWRNARARLSPLVYLLMQKQLAGKPGSPAVRTPPILGSNLIASLATNEQLDALGANNLAIIGEARGYLNSTMPSMDGLAKQILSPNSAENGPTQQMQYVAANGAQQTSLAVENLQVHTGVLETVTIIAKDIADAKTADLNMQERHEEALYDNPSGFHSFAEAFTQHP